MKNSITLLVVFFLTLSFSKGIAQEKFSVNGVTVPRTIDFENQKLQLNGFGSRTKFWTEVYVQALYLSQLSEDAKDILDSDTNMGIRLQITSSLVSSQKLSKSLHKGMVKSIGEQNLPQFKMQLDLLEKLLNREATVENDAFNLIYSSNEKAILVYKNNQLEGKIPGFDFKKAFFGIWLSNNPVDAELKDALLGKVK
ncbi:chalcone isomerase family protein [Flavobacterium polysaccharolyticum]|uniref:Chalcone isomerase family protein n=1 Tax=Flavobacterium polysaccharolyticum TaxID=3133148 RepID=A0ABU9NJM2_9FLAO